MNQLLLTLVIALFFTTKCFASDWHDHWIQAVEYCHSKNFDKAEVEFTASIKSLEQSLDKTHPHVFVDRARLYLLQNRCQEALIDVNKSFESEFLDGLDLERAILTRMSVYSNLDMFNEFSEDYQRYRAITKSLPQTELVGSKIVIRNAPKSACFQKLLTNILVGCGDCESQEDIRLLDSGVYIIQRKSDSPCLGGSCDISSSTENDCNFW